MATVTSEANKTLLLRFFAEAWNQGELEFLDEGFADDFVMHHLWIDPAVGHAHDTPGRDAAKAVISGWKASFPDLHIAIEDVIAEGDKVAMRQRYRGTHEHEFQGIPATGRVAETTGVTISRVVDGRVVETWDCVDGLAFMQQLGVVPEPEGTSRVPGPQHEAAAGHAAAIRSTNDATRGGNKHAVRRLWDEAWNANKLGVVDEVVHADYFDHGLAPGRTRQGPESTKDAIRELRTAFPDLVLRPDDIVEEDDKVVTRWTTTGTHLGPLGPIGPTGRSASVQGMTWLRLVDGQIVEAWDCFDELGMLFQLGVLPTPGGPRAAPSADGM
jgi:steroid delta-isomerase-like uncharacterized protein